MASKTSQISEEVTAEQIVQFLEAHPDFIDRRPELLAQLKFSHPVQGATSLIERQVQVLREDQAANRQRFERLAANAELNQRLLEKIEKFTIELLDCRSAQTMVSRAHHLIKELFGLTGSQLLLADAVQPELSKGVQRCDTEQLGKLAELLKNRTSFMGQPPDWLGSDTAELLPGNRGSIAIVPLALERGRGYILLASRDELRFRDDMGSNFLAYLAALISRLLDRLE